MKTGPVHALVVDDDPHICGLIQDGLKVAGLECITTVRSQEAKRLLDNRGTSVSVLVTDIAMPEPDGLELLAYCRKHRPGCEVILITGGSDAGHLCNALRLGAYDFFQKPLDIDQLVASIVRAIAGDAPSRHLSLRAVRAMRLEDQFKRVSVESIQALAKTVEAKDPYTNRHSEQVAHYAVNIAECANASSETIESIRVAALVHDIGKIGVPDHILTKPGSLTKEEFASVRMHAHLGAEILQNISVFATEARFVRHHHERWDGAGYPDGLTGREIPWGARVLNIADSVDTMLMARTYKRAYPVDQVLAEVISCAGGQFDPDLAVLSVERFQKHPEKIIQPAAIA